LGPEDIRIVEGLGPVIRQKVSMSPV